MKRRTFLTTTVGITTALAGCIKNRPYADEEDVTILRAGLRDGEDKKIAYIDVRNDTNKNLRFCAKLTYVDGNVVVFERSGIDGLICGRLDAQKTVRLTESTIHAETATDIEFYIYNGEKFGV
jgi:hypothetical protein